MEFYQKVQSRYLKFLKQYLVNLLRSILSVTSGVVFPIQIALSLMNALFATAGLGATVEIIFLSSVGTGFL